MENTVLCCAAEGRVVPLNRLHHFAKFICEKIKMDLRSIDRAQGLLAGKL